MAIYLDRRQFVTGRNGQIKLDNAFNLNTFTTNIATPIADAAVSSLQDSLQSITVAEESYAVLSTDYRVFVDQTSVEAVTITLPAAAGLEGKSYFIKAITYTDPVTVTVDGIELIDGATEIVLAAQYEYVEVVSYSGQWYIVNSAYTPAP